MKQKIKIFVDIAMTIVLFVSMSYQFIGTENHEIAGAVMLVLFIVHVVLGRKRLVTLGKGGYSPGRVLLTIIDFATLITMLLLMISGIRMSQSVFAFINIDFISLDFARNAHMVTSHLVFLLVGLHIGLHFDVVKSKVYKTLKFKKENRARSWALRSAIFIASLYGVYALIKREFFTYITLQRHFLFFDFSETVIFYELDLLAIMVLMISIGYYLQKVLKIAKENKHEKIT